jgi:hypothetical protein
MKSFLKSSLVLGLLFTSSLVNAEVDKTVTYQNQRGSVLTVTLHEVVNNTGTLTGTFTTAVGNCPTDMGVPMPITGYYNGNAVAISINFPNCKQVVAMTGTISDTELHTIWLDAAQAKDPVVQNWNSNVIGADHYTVKK